MTTRQCDVLVVGSTLAGLVCGAYAARAGLRVVVVEEETQAKRPPLLREPFLLARGEETALDTVLRELGASPFDRRALQQESPALQILLPDARVDVGGGPRALAEELARYGLARQAAAREWLDDVDARGRQAGRALAAIPRARSSDPLRSRIRFGRSALRIPEAAHSAVPPPPGRVLPLVAAALSAISRVVGSDPRVAPALALRSALREGITGTDAVRGVLDLLRRRFREAHGEVESAALPRLLAQPGRIGVDLGGPSVFARILVVATPARLWVRAGLEPTRWLGDPPDAVPLPTRLVRADQRALSSGMGRRVVDACEPESTRLVLRAADPAEPGVDWLVERTGGPAPSEGTPLGAVPPFPGRRILPADPGPPAHWDVGGDEIRVRGRGWGPVRSTRPLVLSVGPDVAPTLGSEGELWIARRVGSWIAEQLGEPARTTRAPRIG